MSLFHHKKDNATKHHNKPKKPSFFANTKECFQECNDYITGNPRTVAVSFDAEAFERYQQDLAEQNQLSLKRNP